MYVYMAWNDFEYINEILGDEHETAVKLGQMRSKKKNGESTAGRLGDNEDQRFLTWKLPGVDFGTQIPRNTKL